MYGVVVFACAVLPADVDVPVLPVALVGLTVVPPSVVWTEAVLDSARFVEAMTGADVVPATVVLVAIACVVPAI